MANSVTRQLLIQEVFRRGWTYETVGDLAELLLISNGSKTISFFGSRPEQSSANGRQISVSKSLTLAYLELLGYEVPAYKKIANEKQALSFLRLHRRIVIKPDDSGQSKGVTVNITKPAKLTQAYKEALRHSEKIIAQKQISGKLYRIFVLNGEVQVVTERRAAMVVGNGSSTVEQLVIQLNEDPRRGKGSDTPMKKIDLTKVKHYVGDDIYHSILPQGVAQRVSAIESVSEGGEAYNVTESVHPSWIDAAITITDALGLFVAGFDIMTDDISMPVPGKYIPLLEINSMPGLKIHEFPSHGKSVALAPRILDAVFES